MPTQSDLLSDNQEWVVTRDELATLMGLDISMVSKLTRQGMPKLSHGRYDLGACVRWYLDFWRDKAAGSGTKTEKRDKLLAEQTEKLQLENAKLRGELLGADVVAHAIHQAASAFSTQLDNLAPRLTPLVVTAHQDPPTLQRIIADECRTIRTNLAEQFQAFGDLYNRQPDTKATPRKKRRRVGRRKPHPAPRGPGTGAVAD